MIENIVISGAKINENPDLKKYINKKIGKLDKYIPRRARQSLKVDVRLKEETKKSNKQHTCEVIMRLPYETITTKETTVNMFAAVDIVETKLKNQLKRYKGQHSVLRHRTRRLIDKFRSQ